MTPQAQDIVDKLASYTEISPGGTGLHIFILAPGADITRHRKKDYFLEIYSERRYFTVTGNTLNSARAIETRTSELQAIHDTFLLSDAGHKAINLPLPITAQSYVEQDNFLRIGLERGKLFVLYIAFSMAFAN